MVKIEKISVSTYQVPTDGPESDGTLEWDKTVPVLVEPRAGDAEGLGFTYASKAAAVLIHDTLEHLVLGRDPMDIEGIWHRLMQAVRNLGSTGISTMAISALDIALWDLKAKLLRVPLVKLLGQVRPGIAAYGSGGFTSYAIERLQRQLGEWAKAGLRSVKMKIGRDPAHDRARLRAARQAIPQETELYVDANGAYNRKQALYMAGFFEEAGITWYEEPVDAKDVSGLAFVRRAMPGSVRIAAGEYAYNVADFRQLLEGNAVDVLQGDATRCAGITGFMRAAALSEAQNIPFSAHTAPSVHQHACCALNPALNVEYFYDHYRIEHWFFDGAASPVNGELKPDLSRPGLGLEFKRADAAPYAR
jgi:L-alanine-DL-glutamate epimerase-like enolase superfamily enzyme